LDSGRLPVTEGLEEGDTLAVGRARVFHPGARAAISLMFPMPQAPSSAAIPVASAGRLLQGTPEMMFTALYSRRAGFGAS
jgi:hypothetical protein